MELSSRLYTTGMGGHRAAKPPHAPWTRALFFGGMFCVGALAGWGATELISPPSQVVHDSGVRLSGAYKFVSPLLICSSTEQENSSTYATLQSTVNGIIASAKSAGELTDASVYFRDFSGRWVDINGDAQYAPASLLKVPLMIAYYKEAESDPGVLSQVLTYTGTDDLNAVENYKSPDDLVPGTYTVEQLITAMIEHSDNNAEALLTQHLDPKWLGEVYTDLGLTLEPGGSGAAEDITAKQYSYFFRVLYNGTYLTPEDSEKALELLTDGDFSSGISAPIPATISVAQKFGERTLQGTSGKIYDRELHDCGIVYAASHPYFLCVMTRGSDFTQLSGVIQSISKAVYQEVNG